MNVEETNLLLEIYKEVKNITTKAIPRIEKQLEEIPKIKKEMEEMKVLVQEIPKMKKEIEEMKALVNEIPKMKKQIEEMKVLVDEIPEMKKQLEEIPKIKKQLEEIPKMKEELRKISGSVARIEVEHGEKLMALFDAFKVHSEKISEQDSKIEKIEKRLQKHDDMLYFLNQKVQRG